MAVDREMLDAVTSDPVTMGWMQGFPPLPENRVLAVRADHMRFPTTRFAFSHMREFVPTSRVSRGPDAPSALPPALRDDLDSVTFMPIGTTQPMRWDEAHLANFTDAILVLHRGAVVYERYFGVTRPDSRHIVFSVTKSFVGTLAEMLIAQGRLDPASPIAELLPELSPSGFADATVRQVLDMTTALDFSEEYTDPNSGIGAFSMALGLTPRPAGYSGPTDLYSFLPTIAKAGTHGEKFTYRTCNTEVLGWIIARIEGKRLSEVLSERIWQPLGMEGDADFLIDSTGMAFAGGGLNPTLRDLARFGEAMRLDGAFNGNQVIPSSVVDVVRRGGQAEHFRRTEFPLLPGWSYGSQWWVSNDNHGTFSARGIHGQTVWIDPVAETVIARFASHPIAANSALDPTSLPAYRAIAEHLMK
jgi:CubicO group peptidase (beta-lactamase class C family)